MPISRRQLLINSGTLLTLPLIYMGSSYLDALQSSKDVFSGRFVNPLRLPGQQNLYTPLAVKDLAGLTALPVQMPLRGGRPVPLWLYAAQLAGQWVYNPILIARPGDKVSLRFENRIPQPSIIHWHGFTNDSHNDGAGMEVAAPGAGYDYDWTVHNQAALNWYHPHPHQHAGEQTWYGLSSLFIVEDEVSERLANALGTVFGVTDIPLLIQDRTLERGGGMPYSDNPKRHFHGMSGNTVLVNLTPYPVLDLPRRWVRFRIVNGSNARLYRLAFVDESRQLPFMLLGTDNQMLTTPHEAAEIFLAPAQRLDVALDLHQTQAAEIWLKTLPFDPMHNEMGNMGDANSPSMTHSHGASGEGALESLLRIRVQPYEGNPGRLPSRLAGPLPIPQSSTRRDFFLDHDGEGVWRINGLSFFPPPAAETASRAANNICQSTGPRFASATTYNPAHRAFEVKRGTQEIWTIRNDSASMPHPMHLHGFSFSVLARRDSPAQLQSLAINSHGQTAQDLGRLDTVLVWPGETVDIAVDFSGPFSAEQRYMFHCHNLEHEDLGMMLAFAVID